MNIQTHSWCHCTLATTLWRLPYFTVYGKIIFMENSLLKIKKKFFSNLSQFSSFQQHLPTPIYVHKIIISVSIILNLRFWFLLQSLTFKWKTRKNNSHCFQLPTSFFLHPILLIGLIKFLYNTFSLSLSLSLHFKKWLCIIGTLCKWIMYYWHTVHSNLIQLRECANEWCILSAMYKWPMYP